jgi:hypothetical protein
MTMKAHPNTIDPSLMKFFSLVVSLWSSIGKISTKAMYKNDPDAMETRTPETRCEACVSAASPTAIPIIPPFYKFVMGIRMVLVLLILSRGKKKKQKKKKKKQRKSMDEPSGVAQAYPNKIASETNILNLAL